MDREQQVKAEYKDKGTFGCLFCLEENMTERMRDILLAAIVEAKLHAGYGPQTEEILVMFEEARQWVLKQEIQE